MLGVVKLQRSPWSIFDELESLQHEMNDVFSSHGYRGGAGQGRYPFMNVWSSTDGLVADIELPGVDPAAVEVSVEGDELTVRGSLNAEQPAQEGAYHRRERPSGEFARSLRLPYRADADAVKARYTNGVLRVTVPRSKADRPRKVAVETA